MTKVKFLYEKDSENVFAFFPELVFQNIPVVYYTSYAHVGQHSACSIDYANECKEAGFNAYCDLLNELIGQGYNDLQILNSQELECKRPPTKGELKFGEGATHYRSFPLSVVGLKKNKAIWKDWFIAPDDKLRYYTK